MSRYEVTKPEIEEVYSLEELYARRGVSVFRSVGEKTDPIDVHEYDLLADARNPQSRRFIEPTLATVIGFGGDATKYSENSGLHVDLSERQIHLVLRGEARAFFGRLAVGETAPYELVNAELAQIPRNEYLGRLAVVYLKAGDYVAFGGLRSGAPHAHAFESLSDDRVSAVQLCNQCFIGAASG